MKLKSIILFMIFYSNVSTSQTYEIGVSFGGTNFIGDVGEVSFVNPDDYISKSQISGGFIFKWNRSKRHSFRFSVLKLNTYANDNLTNDPGRLNRGLAFTTDITELSLGVEYTFWDWNLHEFGNPFTPYLYTGPTYFFTNNQRLEDNELVERGMLSNIAIPMVFGVKYRFAFHWVISAEIGARYTLTDNIDGSSPSEINQDLENLDFGNLNSNDWYLFSGINLTYTFGRKPCYCKF